jgi:hypothetical protein
MSSFSFLFTLLVSFVSLALPPSSLNSFVSFSFHYFVCSNSITVDDTLVQSTVRARIRVTAVNDVPTLSKPSWYAATNATAHVYSGVGVAVPPPTTTSIAAAATAAAAVAAAAGGSSGGVSGGGGGGGLEVLEGEFLSIGGVVVGDVDVDETFGGAVKLTLSAAYGALSVAGSGFVNALSPSSSSSSSSPSSSSSSSSSSFATDKGWHSDFRFFGSIRACNRLLATLRYKAPAAAVALSAGDAAAVLTDTVVVGVDDRGNSGAGGNKSASLNFTLSVLPRNDAPTVVIGDGRGVGCGVGVGLGGVGGDTFAAPLPPSRLPSSSSSTATLQSSPLSFRLNTAIDWLSVYQVSEMF